MGSRADTFGGKTGTIHAGDWNYAAEFRVLNKYLDVSTSTSPAVTIFQCPGDKKPPAGFAATYSNFDYEGSSYNANESILMYNPDFEDTGPLPSEYMPRPLSTITSPTSKVWLENCIFVNNPGHGVKGYYVGGQFSKALVIVLFADGHVQGPLISPYDDFENYNPATTKKAINDPNGTPNRWD